MKIQIGKITTLAAVTASACLLASTIPASAQDFSDYVNGTLSLGAPSLRVEDPADPESDPQVVYPVTFSGVVTAELPPTFKSSTKGNATTTTETSKFGTSKVTNATLLGLLGVSSSQKLVFVTDVDGAPIEDGLFTCNGSLTTGTLTAADPNRVSVSSSTEDLASVAKFGSSTTVEVEGEDPSTTASTISGYASAGILFDGYGAEGIGSFNITQVNNAKFSANQTSTYARLSLKTPVAALNGFDNASGNAASLTIATGNSTTYAGAGMFDDINPLAAVTYSIGNNTLTGNVTINSATGEVSLGNITGSNGTVTVVATQKFAGGTMSNSAVLSVTVTPAVPVITLASTVLGVSQTGTSPSGFITATNSNNSTAWSYLPTVSNLSLSSNTTTPQFTSANATAGTYTVGITARNTGGNSTVSYLTITVNP